MGGVRNGGEYHAGWGVGLELTSDSLASEDVCAVRADDVDKYGRAVADGRDGLAGVDKLVDQGDGVLVGREVEHGAVAARVEEGSVLGGLAEVLADLGGVLPQAGLGLEEFLGLGILLEHLTIGNWFCC